MATKKKPVKDKVKAKAKAVKTKVKGKVKTVLALVALSVLAGCMDTAPASRATTATYTFAFEFDDSARGNTINLTLGDGALASADSSGSTETQTATPTLDIRTKIDARYNDAIAGATSASKGVLESLLSTSANKVLEMMQSKETGTVKVQKTDGSEATVKCENGQCSFCEDCEAK